MNGCEEIRDLIPWYLEGTLSSEESAVVAGHLASCSDCLRDVAVAIRLRTAVRDAVSSEPQVSEAIWERVARQAMGRKLAQLDVGSFLVGFRLGTWLTRRGSPVRADLRVLGHDVHLVERKRGGMSS